MTQVYHAVVEANVDALYLILIFTENPHDHGLTCLC